VIVDVAVTPAALRPIDAGRTVAVLDVLRATTTIVAALAEGASSVLPFEEPEEALAFAELHGRTNYILGGERESRKIPGFDLDNSPRAYTRERVNGVTIVFTTTNGTRALRRAAEVGSRVLIATLRNRTAVAHALLVGGGDATLVCAGSQGDWSFEDFIGAGSILAAMRDREPGIALGDGAFAALSAYARHARALHAAVARGTHARHLIDAGFSDDVVWCCEEDRTGIVPVLTGGTITAA
jgi:2-phosphosulfolactate phosphatase